MENKRQWTPIKEYTDILFEQCGGIAKITINRPKVYNAFRPLTNAEMLDAMNICRDRQDIGVVILTGAGDKAFCSGGDQNYKTLGGYKDSDGTPRLNVLDLQKAIRSIPKPVIAMATRLAAEMCSTPCATSRLLLKTPDSGRRDPKWAVSTPDSGHHIWLDAWDRRKCAKYGSFAANIPLRRLSKWVSSTR